MVFELMKERAYFKNQEKEMLLYLYPRVIQYFKSRESFIVIHNEHLVYKILKDKRKL